MSSLQLRSGDVEAQRALERLLRLAAANPRAADELSRAVDETFAVDSLDELRHRVAWLAHLAGAITAAYAHHLAEHDPDCTFVEALRRLELTLERELAISPKGD